MRSSASSNRRHLMGCGLLVTLWLVGCGSSPCPPATQPVEQTQATSTPTQRKPSQSSPHHAHEGHHAPHRFEDAEAWVDHFEGSDRDAWQKPQKVVELLGLDAEDSVADIGSGTGYFAVRLAEAVPQGHVWGVDVEPDMVRYLNERAQRQELDNVFSILGTADDPLLPRPVDAVLMVNTYHHIQDRVTYFETLHRYLSNEARVAIVDFKQGELPVGPPDSMKIAPEQIRRELKRAGFEQVAAHTDALPHQFMLIFERTTRETPQAIEKQPALARCSRCSVRLP